MEAAEGTDTLVVVFEEKLPAPAPPARRAPVAGVPWVGAVVLRVLPS